MRNKLHKVLTAALCVTLLTVTAACTSKEKAPSQTTGSADKTPVPASEKPIVDVLIFARNTHEIETQFGREILDYWGEKTKTNIKIEQPPNDGYDQKLQILLASGDKLPDLIRMSSGPSSTLYQKMVKEGLALALDDYMKLMPDVLKKIPKRTIDAFRVNGKLYEIPLNQSENMSRGTYFRYDWLKKLGYNYPLDKMKFTIDEFFQIVRDFTFKDPDGNGKNDTYGFVMPNNAGWFSVIPDIILNATGSGRYWQEDKDGNLTDSILTTDWDKTKDAIKLYKKMFDEKIIDPEVFLLGGEQVRDKLYRGVVGGVQGFGSAGSGVGFITGIRGLNPDALLIWANQITGPNATQERYASGMSSSGWVISADSKYPDRVVEMLNYTCTEEGLTMVHAGVPGKHYESIDANLNIKRTEAQQKKFDEFFRSRPWQWGIRGEATSRYDAPEQIRSYDKLAGFEGYGKIQVNIAYGTQIKPAMDKNTGFLPAKSEAVINMDEEWKTVLQKFLVGEVNEAALDAMRDKYLTKGYNDFIKQADKLYKANK